MLHWRCEMVQMLVKVEVRRLCVLEKMLLLVRRGWRGRRRHCVVASMMVIKGAAADIASGSWQGLHTRAWPSGEGIDRSDLCARPLLYIWRVWSVCSTVGVLSRVCGHV